MIVAAIVGWAHVGEDASGAEFLEGALGEMEHVGYIVGVEEEGILVDGGGDCLIDFGFVNLLSQRLIINIGHYYCPFRLCPSISMERGLSNKCQFEIRSTVCAWPISDLV